MDPLPYLPPNMNSQLENSNSCVDHQRNSPNVMMKELNWLDQIKIKSLPVLEDETKVLYLLKIILNKI